VIQEKMKKLEPKNLCDEDIILHTLENLVPVTWGESNKDIVETVIPLYGFFVSVILPRDLHAKFSNPIVKKFTRGAEFLSTMVNSKQGMWIYYLSAFVHNSLCHLPEVTDACVVPPVRIVINTSLESGVSNTSNYEGDSCISLCLKYITLCLDTRGTKETVREIAGVLVHEFSRLWQKQVELSFSKSSAKLRPLSASDSRMVEGIADAIRISAQLSARHWNINSAVADKKAAFDRGGEVSAFFLLWLENHLYKNQDIFEKFLIIPKINFAIMTRTHGAASAFKSEVHCLEPFFSRKETLDLWNLFCKEVSK